MSAEDWVQNSNGNWLWFHDDNGHVATAYACSHGTWRGIWNGAADGKPRRLKAMGESPEEVQSLLEKAALEGDTSNLWWPPDDQWSETKKGSYQRRVNGATVTVKKTKTGSWYAVQVDGLLGRAGHPLWFSTADEARKAVNLFALGSGNMDWITRQ